MNSSTSRLLRFYRPFVSAAVTLAAFSGGGCATIHPGVLASHRENLPLPLKVSAEASDGSEGSSLGLYTLTFENLNDDWLRVNEFEVLIEPSEATKISVVVGKDLVDWASSLSETQELEGQHKQVALASTAALGALTSILTHNSSSSLGRALHVGGGLALGGAVLYAATDTINQSREQANRPNWTPGSHAATPFAVPGRSFLRRWVLLNKPADAKIKTLSFRLKTSEGTTGTYDVAL